MKIGIFTIIRSESPGALWQAFATYRTLENLGHQVYFITAYPRNKVKVTKDNNLIKYFTKRYKSSKYFENTIFYADNNLKVFVYKEIDDVKIFDMILVGSDQVFNYSLCRDENFLPKLTGIKKASFSSSFGSTHIQDIPNIVSFLKAFYKVSIREEEDCKLLNKMGIYAVQHVDPTFLFSKKDWLACVKNGGKKENYILLFGLSSKYKTLDFARKIKKQTKCKIILTNYYGMRFFNGVKLINRASCFDLLYLISKAKYVITHSYHAFLLSLNFNVDVFYAYDKHNKSSERFISAISKFSLPNKNIVDSELFDVNTPYDWVKVNSIIERERKKSLLYLKGLTNNEM